MTTQLPALSVFSFEPDLAQTDLDGFATEIDTFTFEDTIVTPVLEATRYSA